VKFENINMNISNNQLYENNKNSATAYNFGPMNSLNPANLKNYNLSNNNNINNFNKQMNKNAINFNENNNYNSNDMGKNPNVKKKNMNMNSNNNGKIKKSSINKKYDKNNNMNNPHNKANDMNSNMQGKPLYNSMNDFFNKRHNIENINSNINNEYINNHPLIEDLYGSNFEYIKHNNNAFLSNNNHKNSNTNTNINNNKLSKASYAINYNNNNIHNTYTGYTKNKPLNNFNPNLIKKKETQTPIGHTLLNRNKSNLEEGPVKIKKNNYLKNLNNNHTEHNQSNKKPLSPELNHYDANGFSSENNNYNSNHSMKKTNSSSILGTRAAFMKQNEPNPGIFIYDKKNNVKNKFNNNFIKRPSTAPHKDKVKVPAGLVNKKNYKISDKKPKITKYNQRPQSAEGGGKNKHIHKNYNATNNFINGRMGMSKNLSNSNVAGEMNNSKEYRINSIKNSVQNKGIHTGNTNIYNKNLFVGSSVNPKYRMPSPMIKHTNIQKNTAINNGRKFTQINH